MSNQNTNGLFVKNHYKFSKISLFAVLLVCSLLPSDWNALQLNENGSVKKYNLDYTENGTLSYKGGKWRKFEQNEANEDERIAEFFPDSDYFVDVRDDDSIQEQILLRPFKNVISFYKNKKPLVGTSIKNQEGVESDKLEDDEVASYLEENVEGEAPEKLELLNSLPLMKLDDKFNRKTEEMNDAQKQLREMLDGPTENDPKKGEFYIPNASRFYPEMNQQLKNKVLTSIVKSLIENVYKVGISGDEEMEENKEQLATFTMTILKKIAGNGSANVGHIVNSLTYFTMKAMRYYFVYSSVHFFDDLFKNYVKGESTLETLMDKFEEEACPNRIMRNYFFKNLQPELILDANNREADNMEDAMMGENHVDVTRNKLVSSLKEFYKEHLEELREIAPKAADNLDQFEDDEILEHAWDIIRDDLFKLYFDVMFSMIKEYMPKLPCFLAQGFDDLNESTEQLSEMRKYFRVLGFVKYDQSVDEESLSYIDVGVFSEMRREILI